MSNEAVTAPIPITRSRRRRPSRTPVLVGALVVVLLIGAGIAVASSASSFSALDPCKVSAGAKLDGFEHLVGPEVVPEAELVGAQTAFCGYNTPGGAPWSYPGGGSVLTFTRLPRASVEADAMTLTSLRWFAAKGTPPYSSSTDLPRSGVSLTQTESPNIPGGTAGVAVCLAGDDYWSIGLNSFSRDDRAALDGVLDEMGCGPSGL